MRRAIGAASRLANDRNVAHVHREFAGRVWLATTPACNEPSACDRNRREFIGTPGGIRTPDPRVRSLSLLVLAPIPLVREPEARASTARER